MAVFFDLLEQPQSLDLGNHLGARLDAVEAAISFGRVVVKPSALIEHIDLFEAVAATNLEVVEVVRRRDFDGTGTLFGIGVVVGDDSKLATDDRQHRFLSDEVADRRDARRHRYHPAWSRAASSPR